MKTICKVLSAVLVWACSPPAGALAQSEAYGVVAATQFLNNDSEGPGLQRIQELGVGSVRVSAPWKVIQPIQNGSFQWGWLDEHMLNAYNSGLDIFVNLGEPPQWATPCEYCVPNSMSEWYTYVRAVLERYSWMGWRVTYGVWNEPNDTKFLKAYPGEPDSQPAPASRYVPLVQQAIQARNDSQTNARFALGDTTPAAMSWWWWDFYSWHSIGSAMAWYDLIAVHWYPDGNLSNYSSIYNYLDAVIQLTGREVWLTETGPTTPTPDWEQVENVNRLVDAFQQRPGYVATWTKLFYYRIWGEVANQEALLTQNWLPRPAFYTYRDRIANSNPPSRGGRLDADDRLYPDDVIYSGDGAYRLIYQQDGNLVVYRQSDGQPVWDSGTWGTFPGYLHMQGDGNLVIYDGNGQAIWHTATQGNSGAYAELGNDGVLRVYNSSNTVIWSS